MKERVRGKVGGSVVFALSLGLPLSLISGELLCLKERSPGFQAYLWEELVFAIS